MGVHFSPKSGGVSVRTSNRNFEGRSGTQDAQVVVLRRDGALRVVDYKSGGTRYSLSDVQNGLAFQAPLYALAAERLLGKPAAESYYLHIALREPSGKLKFDEGAQQDAAVQAALAVAQTFSGPPREHFLGLRRLSAEAGEGHG